MRMLYIMRNFFFLLLMVLLFIGCTSNLSKGLPDSFTINLYADASSSGGSRYFNQTLVFDHGELFSGVLAYEIYTGDGRNFLYECILDTRTNSWVNSSTNTCVTNDISGFSPPTSVENKSTLEELMAAPGNVAHIRPADQCMHGETCYTIR